LCNINCHREYIYIYNHTKDRRRDRELSTIKREKKSHLWTSNIIQCHILFGKQDANTAFRHPLHPYPAWKTLNYLPTEVKNFPLDNNNFVIMAIYSLRRPTNNTNIRGFWSYRTECNNTKYVHGMTFIWGKVVHENIGYVGRDKEVTPVELNAGFKVTCQTANPNI
jgi:hypothetical protein